jgi:hypothetical protein
VLALLGVGLGVLAPWRSGDAATTTPLRVADDVVHTDAGLDYTRSYAVTDDGKRLTGSVRLVNSKAETIKQAWFEVLPSSLATSLDDARFTPKPDGTVDGELAVYWVLDLSPGEERTLSWTVAVPAHADPSRAYLRQVRGDVAQAAADAQPATDAKRAELAQTDGVSATEPQPVDTPVVASGQDAGTVPGGVPGAVPGAGGSVPGGGTTTTGTDGGTGTTGDSGPVNLPGGGATNGGSNGGTQAGNPAPAPAPAPAANHAPTISASNQTNDELSPVSVTFSASDPDNDGVTITVSGLPAGLSASNGRVSGTIPFNAVTATTDWHNIRSQPLTVSIKATDARGMSSTASITWTVRDTATTMFNYVGTYGCGNNCAPNPAEGGWPNLSALTTHDGFSCVVDPSRASRVVAQTVPGGQVISWGQFVHYTYANNSC